MKIPDKTTERLDLLTAERLRARKGEWPEVVRLSRCSLSWIWQFTDGRIPNPKYLTLLNVSAALDALDERDRVIAEQTAPSG